MALQINRRSRNCMC